MLDILREEGMMARSRQANSLGVSRFLLGCVSFTLYKIKNDFARFALEKSPNPLRL
jgi:hypothetical protein